MNAKLEKESFDLFGKNYNKSLHIYVLNIHRRVLTVTQESNKDLLDFSF